MRFMKYVENASRNDATTAIAVGDGRPTIKIGGSGEMTEREITAALAMGHILVDTDDGGLSKMTVAQLDTKAEKLGVELGSDDDKDAKASKLRTRLADGPENTAEAAQFGGGGTSVTASPGPAASMSGSTAVANSTTT